MLDKKDFEVANRWIKNLDSDIRMKVINEYEKETMIDLKKLLEKIVKQEYAKN